MALCAGSRGGVLFFVDLRPPFLPVCLFAACRLPVWSLCGGKFPACLTLYTTSAGTKQKNRTRSCCDTGLTSCLLLLTAFVSEDITLSSYFFFAAKLGATQQHLHQTVIQRWDVRTAPSRGAMMAEEQQACSSAGSPPVVCSAASLEAGSTHRVGSALFRRRERLRAQGAGSQVARLGDKYIFRVGKVVGLLAFYAATKSFTGFDDSQIRSGLFDGATDLAGSARRRLLSEQPMLSEHPMFTRALTANGTTTDDLVDYTICEPGNETTNTVYITYDTYNNGESNRADWKTMTDDEVDAAEAKSEHCNCGIEFVCYPGRTAAAEGRTHRHCPRC